MLKLSANSCHERRFYLMVKWFRDRITESIKIALKFYPVLPIDRYIISLSDRLMIMFTQYSLSIFLLIRP